MLFKITYDFSNSVFLNKFIENKNSETTTQRHPIRYSCLNLVDLAGSERLTDYDSKNEAFGETGHINKSLFVLSNVINKLADGKQYTFYLELISLIETQS